LQSADLRPDGRTIGSIFSVIPAFRFHQMIVTLENAAASSEKATQWVARKHRIESR